MTTKKFHVVREIVTKEVFEVNAHDIDDAVGLLKLQEARLLTTTESEPVVVACWEKPTALSDPE